MLISLKAGGIGLNLVWATHVFLMDPWWNPQIENQAGIYLKQFILFVSIQKISFRTLSINQKLTVYTELDKKKMFLS